MFALEGKALDVKQLGEKLGVAAVVEGSVRKAGNRVRATARLVNVADGYQLWTESYEGKLTDIFSMQDRIAAADDLASRTDPITLKFYGSREARAAANMKRTEHGTIASSFLIRTVDPKPMVSSTMTPRP